MNNIHNKKTFLSLILMIKQKLNVTFQIKTEGLQWCYLRHNGLQQRKKNKIYWLI